jgi:hypothetical protein
MRRSAKFLGFALLFFCLFPAAAQNQKAADLDPKILAAQTVYFDDQSGVAAVGRETLAELKKWGRFQIAKGPQHADIVLRLSAAPYTDGAIIYSGGQTGDVDEHGNIHEDPVPNYTKGSAARYAYLNVIEPTTGRILWSDGHVWGGLLTGFNSVGARLVGKLKKQMGN